MLERLFSKDQHLGKCCDEEICEDDEIESSKTRIPFNKAFLSLALVEPQRTISTSLDELDRCFMNKADVINGLEHLRNRSDNGDEIGRVTFDESPNIHSLSTISEHSDSTLSPLQYPRKGFLENAIDNLSSNEEKCNSGDVDPEFLEALNKSIETKKSVSVADTVETINEKSQPQPSKEDVSGEKDSDEELSQHISKHGFFQFRKVLSSDELLIFEKRDNLDSPSEIPPQKTHDDEFQIIDQPAESRDQQYPKSILKKKDYELSGVLSEPLPMKRRHTVVPNQFFGRGIKSVSNLCDSPSSRKIFPQKQKKHSAPARMPLTRLKSRLKINRKFLSSLQQTDNSSRELIELLAHQAEHLNQDIKRTLMLNALQYGGIALVAILITCGTLRYCIKNKRCT